MSESEEKYFYHPRACQDLKKYFPGQKDATSATGTLTRRRWLRWRRRRRRSSLPPSRRRRPSPTLARGCGATGQGGDQDREKTERQGITLSILMCFSWSKLLYILIVNYPKAVNTICCDVTFLPPLGSILQCLQTESLLMSLIHLGVREQ